MVVVRVVNIVTIEGEAGKKYAAAGIDGGRVIAKIGGLTHAIYVYTVAYFGIGKKDMSAILPAFKHIEAMDAIFAVF